MRINSKIIFAGLIAVNLIIWPLFIIPGIVGLLHSGRLNNKNIENINFENGPVPEVIPVYGDFSKIRNPFYFLNTPKSINPVNSGNKNNRQYISSAETSKSTMTETYKSKFRLKSIVQSKNVYTATLEEVPNYGNVQNPVTPYSYRFGSQPETPESKSYLVSEKDVLQDEIIIVIKENFVILEKNGQYYRLTFSGGSPVAHP